MKIFCHSRRTAKQYLVLHGSISMTKSKNDLKVDKNCAIRFVAFGALMGFVNIALYLYTRKAIFAHNIQAAGWPLICHK